MSGELKKEFNPRDVQRMRNIITGQTGDRTQIQTGYENIKEYIKKEMFGRRAVKNGLY
jgi:hypothetical protein